MEDTELLRDVSLTSIASVVSWSAMVTAAMFWGMRGSTQSVCRNARVRRYLYARDG